MTISKILRDTLIIAWIKSFPDFRRNPMMLVLLAMISAIPLFFMMMFSGGGNMIVHGLIGAMVSSVAFAGVNSGIQDISWDRYVKIREMIVAMPVHPASYALGIALAPLLVSIPSLILFGAITAYLGFFTLEALGWTVLALILVWAATSSMGFMISTYLFKSSPMMLNNFVKPAGHRFHFHSPSLLFRSSTRQPKLDITHCSNVKCCRPHEVIHGALAVLNRVCDNQMGCSHHNDRGVRRVDFSEIQVARELNMKPLQAPFA